MKRGDPTKLMVFFMGGGACWNITNCVYNHTYAEDLFESVMLLGLVSAGAAEAARASAVCWIRQIPDNPFRDWTIVYVPYCTGDLNAGQEDYTYPDTYNPVNPVPVDDTPPGRGEHRSRSPVDGGKYRSECFGYAAFCHRPERRQLCLAPGVPIYTRGLFRR